MNGFEVLDKLEAVVSLEGDIDDHDVWIAVFNPSHCRGGVCSFAAYLEVFLSADDLG